MSFQTSIEAPPECTDAATVAVIEAYRLAPMSRYGGNSLEPDMFGEVCQAKAPAYLESLQVAQQAHKDIECDFQKQASSRRWKMEGW